MFVRILIAALLVAFNLHAEAGDRGMENYLGLDQYYNIPSRANDEIRLMAQDRVRKPVLWRSIPNKSRIKITTASEDDSIEMMGLFRLDEGSEELWMPMHPDAHKTADLRENGTRDRLLSRSTNYYTGPQGEAFFKFSPLAAEMYDAAGQPPVLVTKFWRVLQSHLEGPSGWALLEEPLAVYFKNSLASYAVTVRSASEFRRAFDEGLEVVPLHGLFGCKECLKKIADKAGLSVADWVMQIYLPLFAQSLAEQNIKYGLFLPNHTQNSSAVINPDNGNIERFLFRDLGDAVIDPTPLLASNPELTFEYFNNRPIGLAHTKYVNPAKTPARDPGVNFSFYSAQSIDRLDVGVPTLELMKIFLREYRKKAEEILKQPVQLSAEGEKAWAVFMSARSSTQLITKWRHKGMQRDAAAFLIEEISDFAQSTHLESLKKHLQDLPTTKVSKFELRKLADRNALLFTSRKNRERLEGHLVGKFVKLAGAWLSGRRISQITTDNRTYIVDSSTREILAYSLYSSCHLLSSKPLWP